MVIAADDATHRLSRRPATWASLPNQMWVYHIGPQWAKRLLLTGDTITGAEAAQLGLALKAVPAADLEGEVEQLLDRMAKIDTDLLTANKRIVNIGLELMGARTLQRLAAEIDARGHLAAVGRRVPANGQGEGAAGGAHRARRQVRRRPGPGQRPGEARRQRPAARLRGPFGLLGFACGELTEPGRVGRLTRRNRAHSGDNGPMTSMTWGTTRSRSATPGRRTGFEMGGGAAALALAVAACGGDDTATPGSATGERPTAARARASLDDAVVVVANSPDTLSTRGDQRVMVALLGDGPSQFLGGPDVPATFQFESEDHSVVDEVQGTWLTATGATLGLYVTHYTFPSEGVWAVRLKGGSDQSMATVIVKGDSAGARRR